METYFFISSQNLLKSSSKIFAFALQDALHLGGHRKDVNPTSVSCHCLYPPWRDCLPKNWGCSLAYSGSSLKKKENITEYTNAFSRSQTQVPWRVDRWCFRFLTPELLSLHSEGFCCEMSISALAIASPERKNKKQNREYEDHVYLLWKEHHGRDFVPHPIHAPF